MKDGIILIDKPTGMTSFSVVARVRSSLGVKCGHSGTLDPIATGLLPILCGKATKLCPYISDGDKGYDATLKFGYETDTCDITGTPTEKSDVLPSLEQIRSVIPQFIGEIQQIPPMYSAIKVGGRALYKLAREGKNVDIPTRTITVYGIEIFDYSGGKLSFHVDCTKGTYIRSLCRDIARALGTYGTMSSLRRTSTCGWSVNDAVKLESELEIHILSIDDVLSNYPEYTPDTFFARLLKNGCAVETKKLKRLPNGLCRVYDGELIGIGDTYNQDGGTFFRLVTHL